MHIFGPPARFPLARERRYTPPEASLEALLALHERLGLERVLIVQPSVYGTDNSCTLDALRRLGPRARGVAVTDTRIRENERRRLKRLPVALVVDHFGLAQSTDEVRYLASLLREGNTYVKLSGPHRLPMGPGRRGARATAGLDGDAGCFAKSSSTFQLAFTISR